MKLWWNGHANVDFYAGRGEKGLLPDISPMKNRIVLRSIGIISIGNAGKCYNYEFIWELVVKL